MDLSAASRPTAAVLFLVAVDAGLNAYSSINSSPWTAESFGGDPEKADSCRSYVLKADIVTLGLSGLGSMIAGNLWPLIGGIIVVTFMEYMYRKALRKAAENGSKGWDS
jgi:hypothetical protein